MYIKEYKDDPSIGDEENLWRRINPQWFIYDENGQVNRISSAAFSDSRNKTPMSILIEKLVFASARSAEDVMQGVKEDGYGLVAITAGLARQHSQGVAHDREIDDDPAHGVVFGKKTKAVKRAFAKNCAWVILPENENR